MIQTCPRCRKKNRIPDTPPEGGQYRCGQCGEVLQKPRRPLPRPVLLANGLYLLALLALTLSNLAGPERWWPGSLNLYLPQWVWAIPGVPALLLTLRLAPRWSAAPLLALLWVFGPIMGFCGKGLFRGEAAHAGRDAVRLRILTYNVKGGVRDGQAIAEEVRADHPDILQMQDSVGVLRGELGQVTAGWNIRTSGQYIVASPHPLPELESRDISFAGSNHHCVRYTLQIGNRAVTVYNVHLLSPRTGLVSVRHRNVDGLVGNVEARLQETDRLAGYVRQETGPVIVTGDLNAPVQSLVCRRLFDAGLRDAFSETGLGYGYTYGRETRVGHSYVRIDHVLVSREWEVARCRAGNDRGSDHCPVLADLVLP